MGKIDYERLSEQTGIPVWKIEVAMGRPIQICSATTVADAHSIADEADPGSEEEAAALTQWLGLTTTAHEAEILFSFAECDSVMERAALTKWIELAPDFNTLSRAYGVSKGRHEDLLAKAAIRMITLATTIKEVNDVLDVAPSSLELDVAAFAKWLDLANTVEEVSKAAVLAPAGSEIEYAAIRKLVELRKVELA